jgi:hypothetical protein
MLSGGVWEYWAGCDRLIPPLPSRLRLLLLIRSSFTVPLRMAQLRAPAPYTDREDYLHCQ